MYFAKIVEERVLPGGPILPPMHPYTEALMSATRSRPSNSSPDRAPVRAAAEFPEIPPGCRFVSRCPRRLKSRL